MFHKKITFLAFASITGLCLLSPTAHAVQPPEPELYFYPAKGWVVRTGPIMPVIKKPQNPQCHLTSEFNNGFILQFSGSADHMDTVSLDFRQKIFEQGNSYKTLLVIPGLMEKAVEARAVSGEVLSIDLARVPGFLAAVRKGSTLDMHVEENRFRFYLSAINDALSKYDSCTRDLGPAQPGLSAKNQQKPHKPIPEPEKTPEIAVSEPAKAEETAPAGNEAPASPPLEKQITAGSADEPIKVSIDESKGKEEESEFPERIRGRRLSSLLAEQMDDDALKAVSDHSAETPEETAVKNESSENTVSETSTPAASVNSEDAASPMPAAPPPAIETVGTMKTKTQWPEERKEVGHMEVDFTKVGLADKNRDLTTQEKGMASIENAKLMDKIRELEDSIDALKKQNEILENDLEKMPEDVSSASTSIASDNWDLERATMRYNEAERQIKRLGMELAKERAQRAAEKEELENMLFDPQVTSQQQIAKLAELEEKLATAQTKLREQQAHYEAQIKALETKVQKN